MVEGAVSGVFNGAFSGAFDGPINGAFSGKKLASRDVTRGLFNHAVGYRFGGLVWTNLSWKIHAPAMKNSRKTHEQTMNNPFTIINCQKRLSGNALSAVFAAFRHERQTSPELIACWQA
ncbi:MAG: hypothetical protein ACO3R5_02755 [Pseudohongiellaceae bacterium]